MSAAAHAAPYCNPLTYERRDPSTGPLHQLLSARLETYPFVRRKAHEDGFDLDARVSVTAGARDELERLVRYILRPPLKETRLSLHHEGVELTLKTPWRDGTTQVRMSAERFIDRLVALVPPPRANTLLYGWWPTGALALPSASAPAPRTRASRAIPRGPSSCATASAWTSWSAPTAAAACATWPR